MYQANIRPLSKDEGGGYIVEFPEIPGCYADGETPEEAFREAHDALESWLKTAKEFGDPIPKPNSTRRYSGQWRQRVPKSLHKALVRKAKEEGVSLNALTAILLAQALGEKINDGHSGLHSKSQNNGNSSTSAR